ncbi:MAG: hypothetical protein ACOY2B_05265 [Pseudomonadota bacterium]
MPGRHIGGEGVALVADMLGAKTSVTRLDGLTTKAENNFRQKGIRRLLCAIRSALAGTHQALF